MDGAGLPPSAVDVSVSDGWENNLLGCRTKPGHRYCSKEEDYQASVFKYGDILGGMMACTRHEDGLTTSKTRHAVGIEVYGRQEADFLKHNVDSSYLYLLRSTVDARYMEHGGVAELFHIYDVPYFHGYEG